VNLRISILFLFFHILAKFRSKKLWFFNEPSISYDLGQGEPAPTLAPSPFLVMPIGDHVKPKDPGVIQATDICNI